MPRGSETILEKKGDQAVPFLQQDPGERIMEGMVEDGYFIGVIDLVPAGHSEAYWAATGIRYGPS